MEETAPGRLNFVVFSAFSVSIRLRILRANSALFSMYPLMTPPQTSALTPADRLIECNAYSPTERRGRNGAALAPRCMTMTPAAIRLSGDDLT